MAPTEDLTKIKNLLSNTDVIESRTRDQASRKWKNYKLTNVISFVALHKEVSVGCRDTVLPDPLLKNRSVRCLIFEEFIRNDNLFPFRSLALILNENRRLQEENSKIFNLFPEKSGQTDTANVRGVCMQDITAVEDIVHADFFLYDIDTLDGSMIGELLRRCVGKYSNTVQLLRCNRYFCYFFKINGLSETFCCLPSDQFIKKADNRKRQFSTCKERNKRVFPENVYQLRNFLLEKLDSFIIPCSDDQKHFKKMAIFGFEKVCLQQDTVCDTNATTWIGMHVLISVSISSISLKEPIFPGTTNRETLVESFVDALEGLATHSKTAKELKFLETETSVKSNLNQSFLALNQCRSRKEPVSEFKDGCIGNEEEQDILTQFLQTKRNQLIDFQDHIENFATFFQSLVSPAQKMTLIQQTVSCYLSSLMNVGMNQ